MVKLLNPVNFSSWTGDVEWNNRKRIIKYVGDRLHHQLKFGIILDIYGIKNKINISVLHGNM